MGFIRLCKKCHQAPVVYQDLCARCQPDDGKEYINAYVTKLINDHLIGYGPEFTDDQLDQIKAAVFGYLNNNLEEYDLDNLVEAMDLYDPYGDRINPQALMVYPDPFDFVIGDPRNYNRADAMVIPLDPAPEIGWVIAAGFFDGEMEVLAEGIRQEHDTYTDPDYSRAPAWRNYVLVPVIYAGWHLATWVEKPVYEHAMKLLADEGFI